VAGLLEEAFMGDLPYCQEITLAEYRLRPIRIRFKESVSRLFSPVL